MTYKEFKESEFYELMPNGYQLADYDTDEDYSMDDRSKNDWVVKFIGVSNEDFIPAIYITAP